MNFTTIYSFKLSPSKEVRVLKHASSQLFLDVRQVNESRYSKHGLFLAREEAAELITFLNGPLRKGVLNDCLLPSTGRHSVARSTTNGIGIWCNKVSPFSKYTGLFFRDMEFSAFLDNVPIFLTKLEQNE